MMNAPDSSDKLRVSTATPGVSLAEAIVFIRKHLVFLAVAAAVGGGVAGAWALWLTPTVYDATSMITIRDLRGRAESTPVLPLPAYERLLDSGTVRKFMLKLLVRAGVVERGGGLGNRVRLDSSFIVAERNEPGNTALLELRVAGPRSDLVAAVANAWAEAFVTVEQRQARVAAIRQAVADLRAEETKLLDRQNRLDARLEASEALLEGIPRTVRFRSTEEEINPVYHDVAVGAANLRIESEAIEPTLMAIREDVAAHEQAELIIEAARLGIDPDDGVDANEALGRALAAEGASQLLSDAESPTRPRRVRLAARVVIGAAAGVILAFLIALAREAAKGAVSGGARA